MKANTKLKEAAITGNFNSSTGIKISIKYIIFLFAVREQVRKCYLITFITAVIKTMRDSSWHKPSPNYTSTLTCSLSMCEPGDGRGKVY